MRFKCKGCDETFNFWGELWVHRTPVHGARLKIISRDIACLLCNHIGEEFFGTEFEMAFHLINLYPRVAMEAPLYHIVALVMAEEQDENLKREDPFYLKHLESEKSSHTLSIGNLIHASTRNTLRVFPYT